jgi:uroporphyrinogen decarboxylase
MTPRERVLTTLNRKEPDRVPITLDFTPALYEVFKSKTGSGSPAEYFGLEPRHVGIGATRLKTDFSPWLGALPEGASVNEWGEADVPGSMYHFTDYVHPLAKAQTPQEIRDYPWPDILADYRWEGFGDRVRDWQQRGYPVCSGMAHLFEQAWHQRGLENFLCDMAQRPEMAETLLGIINDMRIEYSRRAAEAGADVLYLADDVGTQRGMMMSPAMFRRWIKPGHAAAIAAARAVKPDIHVFYHSDGDIRAIIEDLIEIGITVLNPVQPECMDPAWVKAEYGDRLAFWGTMGTQTTMPFGTPDQVRRVVKERIETVGRGGGLVLAPTHVLEPEVPWENVVAFIEAAREYGRYPLA